MLRMRATLTPGAWSSDAAAQAVRSSMSWRCASPSGGGVRADVLVVAFACDRERGRSFFSGGVGAGSGLDKKLVSSFVSILIVSIEAKLFWVWLGSKAKLFSVSNPKLF